MNLIKFHTVDNFEAWINPEHISNLCMRELPDDEVVIAWNSYGSTEKCKVSANMANKIRHILNDMTIKYP